MTVTVRRIEPGDGEVLQRVRLAALRDSPSAFGSTYEAEVERPAEQWTERAALSASGSERAQFLAIDGDEVVGLVGGFRADAHAPDVDLVSMWTSPTARRQGVGRALVDTVIGWATAVGATSVNLWVTTGNEPATRLYESMGFEQTDDHQPLPSDPCKDETRMILRLPAATG